MAVMFAAGLGAVATAPLMAILTTRAPERAASEGDDGGDHGVTISGPITVLVLGRLLESIDVRTVLFGARHRTGGHGRRVRGVVPRRAGDLLPPAAGEAVA